MKKGTIKIRFHDGVTYTAEVAVQEGMELRSHPQWSRLNSWWLYDNHSNTTLVSWDDGSELLLSRDKILNMSLTPKDVLEII